MNEIRVVNKYKYFKNDGINIMRGTLLGNPFSLKEFTRQESIKKYKIWLKEQYQKRGSVFNKLMNLVALVEAGNKLILICCCKPKACHGDIIKTAIEKIIEKRKITITKIFN